MALNLNRTRDCLQNFEFSRLFIEELGWSQPTSRQAVDMTCKDLPFTRCQVAQLAGAVVFEVSARERADPRCQNPCRIAQRDIRSPS